MRRRRALEGVVAWIGGDLREIEILKFEFGAWMAKAGNDDAKEF